MQNCLTRNDRILINASTNARVVSSAQPCLHCKSQSCLFVAMTFPIFRQHLSAQAVNPPVRLRLTYVTRYGLRITGSCCPGLPNAKSSLLHSLATSGLLPLLRNATFQTVAKHKSPMICGHSACCLKTGLCMSNGLCYQQSVYGKRIARSSKRRVLVSCAEAVVYPGRGREVSRPDARFQLNHRLLLPKLIMVRAPNARAQRTERGSRERRGKFVGRLEGRRQKRLNKVNGKGWPVHEHGPLAILTLNLAVYLDFSSNNTIVHLSDNTTIRPPRCHGNYTACAQRIIARWRRRWADRIGNWLKTARIPPSQILGI
ncbi:uncharacterized protein MYCFIDRAFT_179557 [Pseudocercospora fijiensis CIRAD86]|uniref:Uncharacterized protein n=1 Tax=Pseudocercospora fijiensis (strain CIRAD86) TaxID=383855 RepID=M3A139_PSEFD|nr:uncharacterized protein MYCFIDRAFT_179557 [Pseudocercospora fijiensis CIRAD86]EME78111.1 hypothetical protein MYCFIDRAFT_179557 [Pseudocercospora fijiensis CIRAD86]